MLCSHQFGTYRIHSEVTECPQFATHNRHGGFFLWNNAITSKYQGLWTRIDGVMYKSIAQIQPGVNLSVKKAINHLWGFTIDRGNDLQELYYMDQFSDSLICEMKNPMPISLILDMKEQSDQDEWGRYYDISEKNGCLFVSYTKKNGDAISYKLTLAITGYTHYEIKNEWKEFDYSWDVSRQDPPFKRPLFNSLSLTGKKIVFSIHTNKELASQQAFSVHARADLIKEALKRETDMFIKKHALMTDNNEISAAYLSVKYSLEKMVVFNAKGEAQGMYAGIPWFTQYWVRDFVLSANQIPHNERLTLITGFFNEMEKSSFILSCDQGKCAPGIDSELLLFSLAADMYARKEFTKEWESKIITILKRYLRDVIPLRLQDGFIANGPKETWMDTSYQDNGRAGCRIEIQALLLKVLHFAWQISGDNSFKLQEQDLARKVRLAYWNGETLYDAPDDITLRPNVFLAHYFYPDLFLKHEWEKVFSSALDTLWLYWGGLSTLPKTHVHFCGRDRTGTDPDQSYHHGDSWFFINNISARSLLKINKNKFKPFIEKLIVASVTDILWNGIAGSHSEISSADSYEPRGCLMQSWSAATFADTVENYMNRKVQ